MTFFIAFAVVKSDQGVCFEKLTQQLDVFLYEATVMMQHVELGLFGGKKLEHLGAGSLHHLGFAPPASSVLQTVVGCRGACRR